MGILCRNRVAALSRWQQSKNKTANMSRVRNNYAQKNARAVAGKAYVINLLLES